jgi:hypothetical protein
MEPRRRNPLRRYPTAVCISVWHFGLTQSKTRALNSPAFRVRKRRWVAVGEWTRPVCGPRASGSICIGRSTRQGTQSISS